MKTERHCEKNMGVFPKEITIGAKIGRYLAKLPNGENEGKEVSIIYQQTQCLK